MCDASSCICNRHVRLDVGIASGALRIVLEWESGNIFLFSRATRIKGKQVISMDLEPHDRGECPGVTSMNQTVWWPLIWLSRPPHEYNFQCNEYGTNGNARIGNPRRRPGCQKHSRKIVRTEPNDCGEAVHVSRGAKARMGEKTGKGSAGNNN